MRHYIYMSKSKINIFSVSTFLAGSLFQIFQGYKNETIIDIVSFALIFTGCFLLYTNYFSSWAFDEPRKIKGKVKTLSFLQNTLGFFSKLLFGAIVISSFMLSKYVQEQRVVYILKNEATNITTATIDNIEFRYSPKSLSKRYVIFAYLANGEMLTQPIYDFEKRYSIGQRVRIKYSVEYPKMLQAFSTLKSE